MDALAGAVHGIRQGFAGTRPEEADDAMLRIFQLARVRGRPEALQVARRRIHAQLQVTDTARHQRLIRQLATAHDTIHLLANQIDDAVAHAHIDLDVGVSRVKHRQCGQQNHSGQRAGHIHSQPASGHR
ncbi:hypothetical protein D3C84_820270 [compost metagenome]